MVYEIAGPIFFAAVENFERALLETHLLILRLHRVPFMDITSIQTLEEVTAELRKRGVQVVLCEANARVLGKLQNADVLRSGNDDTHVVTLREALQRAGVGVPAQSEAPVTAAQA